MSHKSTDTKKTIAMRTVLKDSVSKSSSSPEFHPREKHKVFHCLYKGESEDDECIFIETHENGEKSGHLYRVRGDMIEGFKFEHRKAKRPEDNRNLVSKYCLGTIAESNTTAVVGVFRSVPVPGKQFNKRHQKLNVGPVRGGKEWIAEVIAELRSKRLLQMS